MKLHFNQTWVDKATTEDIAELLASGRPSAYQGPYDIDEPISRFATTSAAKEIARRGWISVAEKSSSTSKLLFVHGLRDLFLQKSPLVAQAALFRGSLSMSQYDLFNQMALLAWIAQVSKIAEQLQSVSRKSFVADSLEETDVSELVKLSRLAHGPLKAQEWLLSRGIHFIYLPGLPGMKLDGATFMLGTNVPFIAITLRYDRLDYFWFTLLHELGHVKKHLPKNANQIFVDDLEQDKLFDEIEAEANAFARDSLIPRDLWRRSDAYRSQSKSAVLEFAKQVGIHPAIVAGRIRHETRNYALLTDVITDGSIRDLYAEKEVSA